ncbi:putative transcription factor B3-Domain family [Helianthus annuus]|nr:putative transcription factor B3-Domain family [Helianthus annuus]
MYPKEEKVDVKEVYGVDEQQKKSSGFDAMGTTMMTSGDDQRGMWEIDVRAQQQNLLHEMNDPSMFYNDQFPLIPDFPCMSSSSSSSSNPAPAKPISSTTTTSSASSVSSSTSSAASWAVLKSEYVTEEEGDGNGEERVEEVSGDRGRSGGVPVVSTAAPATETVVGGSGLQLETVGGSGTIDCMDVMENFGYMDLIDGNELWDPSSIFEQSAPDLQPQSEVVQESEMKDGGGGGGGGGLDELGEMFFDWLKSNKESISAEDMRNIKLKRSTVESASKRLGSSKEGKKQLHEPSRQNQNSHQNHVANNDHSSHPMLVDDNSGKSHGENWVYWPSPPSPNTVPLEAPSRPVPSCDRLSKQTSCDKRQELKTEKNLKFLLQKVLKQSDVGSLGRIVLPKKEAESHLPDLDSRDGVSIAMEDIGTSQVWNMRYRFWPNNKSRMYLLENTGDFVKANGLQEGDFIVIYSDVKCGKYLIRGVKVRQPATGKSEGKKPVKRSYRSLSQSARSSPSSPTKIAAI